MRSGTPCGAEYALAHTPTAGKTQQAGFHFGDGPGPTGAARGGHPSKDVSAASWVHSNMDTRTRCKRGVMMPGSDPREFDVPARPPCSATVGVGPSPPSSQEQLATLRSIGQSKGRRREPGAHPVSAERISAVARVYGLLPSSDGVGHRPFYSDTQAASNGVHSISAVRRRTRRKSSTTSLPVLSLRLRAWRKTGPVVLIPRDRRSLPELRAVGEEPDLFKIASAAAGEAVGRCQSPLALRFTRW